VEGGKLENPEKSLAVRQEPTTNATQILHGARNEPRPATLVGSEWSHHCTNSTSLLNNHKK